MPTAQESWFIFQDNFIKGQEPPNMQKIKQSWHKACVDEEETPGRAQMGQGSTKKVEAGSGNPVGV